MYYSLLGRVVKFFEQGTSSNFKNRVASTLGYSLGPGHCQKPTIHHDELNFGVYIYQVTSGSFGANFPIESAKYNQVQPSALLHYISLRSGLEIDDQ